MPALHATDAARPFHILVYSKTLGYRHDSITNGIAAIRELGRNYGFAVDATEDSAAFTQTNLAQYQAVVFLSVTGEVLDQAQKSAFQDYIQGGGGLAAIHGAIFGPLALDETWKWYGEIFCCAFTNHSKILPATVIIEDTNNPSTEGLPLKWKRADEWYNYTGTPRGCAHVLATVDESTYVGGKVGADHPIAWCRQIGRGRMWYTAMGHEPEAFSDPLFCRHLLGGILLAAGQKTADFTPNKNKSNPHSN
jgi:type 1 glutamine amidotransferase